MSCEYEIAAGVSRLHFDNFRIIFGAEADARLFGWIQSAPFYSVNHDAYHGAGRRTTAAARLLVKHVTDLSKFVST